MAIKRLHYFDQQFLVDSDFALEQGYHVTMRRRINKVFHSFGITDGLQVVRSGSRQVTVKAGGAIDRDGREIVLDTDQVIDLSNANQFPGNATVFVTVAYQETQTDPSTATGAPGNTRVTEAAIVAAVTTAPATDGSVVRLARFTLAGSGDVPGNPNDEIDSGVRQAASSKLAAASVAETNLAAPLLTKINSSIATIEGIANPGGNIDLAGTGAISVTGDVTNKKVIITENHSARTDNPHNVTAQQIQALPIAGGTVTGNLQVNGNIGIGIAPATRLHISGASPVVRITDGTQGFGKLLASDPSGNASWRDIGSKYFTSGALNTALVTATSTTPVKLADFVTFTKASADSTIEVWMNTRAAAGSFSSGGIVFYQVRIDNSIATMANEALITTSNAVEFVSIFAVFQGLAAGSHTVSVFVRTAGQTSTGVSLDPGAGGGRIIVKETF
jgi:hypothetical protein